MEENNYIIEKLFLEKKILELEIKLLENKSIATELRVSLENSIFTSSYMKELALKIENS